MTFFPKIPKWKSQNWDSCYPKTLHIHIFFKTTCLEHAKAISYSLQKVPSNGVLHTLIGDHLTSYLKGFLVRSQILNLTPNLPFDHNSCSLGLNEQYEGTLGIYISKSFQWCFGGPIWYLFVFSTKALNIRDSCINSQNGSALGNHWVPSFALSPICKNVFHN
jgi:hypothetical protein